MQHGLLRLCSLVALAVVPAGCDRLYEEVAYVAYHFHWSQEEILDLEHPERHRYVSEIARINTRISSGGR